MIPFKSCDSVTVRHPGCPSAFIKMLQEAEDYSRVNEKPCTSFFPRDGDPGQLHQEKGRQLLCEAALLSDQPSHWLQSHLPAWPGVHQHCCPRPPAGFVTNYPLLWGVRPKTQLLINSLPTYSSYFHFCNTPVFQVIVLEANKCRRQLLLPLVSHFFIHVVLTATSLLHIFILHKHSIPEIVQPLTVLDFLERPPHVKFQTYHFSELFWN